MEAFWSYSKSFWTNYAGKSQLNDKGRICNARKDKAIILNRHYQTTSTQEGYNEITNPFGTPYSDIDEIKEVGKDGIRQLLQNTNPRKSTGPDITPAQILKVRF